MQAATPGAPPPGALGADSLGLPVVGTPPPPPGNVVTVLPVVGDGIEPTPVLLVEGAEPPPLFVVGGFALVPLRKFELGAGASGATGCA